MHNNFEEKKIGFILKSVEKLKEKRVFVVIPH